jgi:lipid-A-disaccharide synthase-like uncharacterized protein
MLWTHIESWWQAAIGDRGWLVLFGLAAQGLFMMRFIVQWIASERARRSIVPEAFWYFSLGGGAMLVIYGLLKAELVIIVGQLPALIVYSRNIVLIHREKRQRGSIDPVAEARREALAE